MFDRVLQHEQQWRRQNLEIDSEAPNIGRDRLLERLREVHGHARYDLPLELMRSLNVPKLVRTFSKR